MFTSLKKGATAVTAVLALAVTVSLALVDTAAAAKTKADILIESPDKLGDNGPDKGKIARPAPSRPAARICCRMRTGQLVLTDPRRCRAARGTFAPRTACPRRSKLRHRRSGNVTLKRGFAKPGRSASTRAMLTKRDAGKVCCSVARKRVPAFLTPSDCRRLKGRILARNKCPQAGGSPSEAYFVKVDRDTTTQNGKPPKPGRAVKR